jgi:hypothetical protein
MIGPAEDPPKTEDSGYPNGNTGRDVDEDFPPVVDTNRIFHDRERP